MVENTNCLFLAGLYQAEKAIAERILRLAAGKPSWPAIEIEKALAWVETKSAVALSESQKQAVKQALASKVLVITGADQVSARPLL